VVELNVQVDHVHALEQMRPRNSISEYLVRMEMRQAMNAVLETAN
jgi:REP element-mobilizing transposase RayT